jgi:hypothetical protein
MKKNYFLTALFALTMIAVNAQTAVFQDDLESWAPGAPVFGAHWNSWSGTTADAGVASDTQALSGAISYYVDGGGAVDGVLDMGNKIFGTWSLEFWAYVPSGKMGYYNVQAGVPVIPSWCGEFYFNRDGTTTGAGEVVGFHAATFAFPQDQWFRVYMAWDISAGLSLATWLMDVDGVNVIPAGTTFVDTNGDTPAGLGGLDIFSAHADSEFYMDDVSYYDGFLGTADFDQKGFSAFPNPVTDVLNLSAKEAISSVSIYNVLGQEVYNAQVNALNTSINTASFTSGAYFVKVNIAGTEGTVKILK